MSDSSGTPLSHTMEVSQSKHMGSKGQIYSDNIIKFRLEVKYVDDISLVTMTKALL